MKRNSKIVIVLALFIIFLLAWAPWITDEFAAEKVTEKIGGPDAKFSYLGQTMSVKDVPKKFGWLPFGRYVGFPSEAVWFVTFYGDVL